MSYFVQLLVSGLVVGSIYALAALGFVLIYKASRVINFAQGEFIAVGAFVVYALSVYLGMNIWLALVISLLLTAVLGFFVERVFLRPLVGQPIISVIMVTIGLASLLEGAIHLTPFGGGNFSFPSFLPQKGIEFAGISVSYPQVLAVFFTLIFLAVFAWFFQRSTLGIAMRAVADDQMAAMSLGVSVEKVFALAWAAAGITAAAAGFIVGTVSGINLGGLVSIGLRVFPVVILGGLDSIPGAVIGGIAIGILENLATGYLDPLVPGGGTGGVFPFVVLLLVLWFKPYGLFGTEEIERV